MILRVYQQKMLVDSHVLEDWNIEEKLPAIKESLNQPIQSMNVEFKHGVDASAIFDLDLDDIKIISLYLKS